MINFFRLSPCMSNLKNTLPGIPRNNTAWIIDRSARTSGRPAIPPFQGGKKSVIRLSLGKLLVNLLQVVKRTNTPRITQHGVIISMILSHDMNNRWVKKRYKGVGLFFVKTQLFPGGFGLGLWFLLVSVLLLHVFALIHRIGYPVNTPTLLL